MSLTRSVLVLLVLSIVLNVWTLVRVYQLPHAAAPAGPVPQYTMGPAPATQPVLELMLSDAAIAAGDTLKIGISDLTAPGTVTEKTVRVGNDGRISLPYVGPISIGGSTPIDAERVVAEAYNKANIIQNAMVTVEAKRSTK